jgi:lipoprotein-anchoring transpeptidase ErfK/SrfK
MTCTSGAASTPTKKGVFTVASRGLSFGSGYTCWYWTQFSGNYLFHSVLYNSGSKTSIQDGRLGINASHGCVRLALADAKWIYDNIPSGTKVVVY